MNQCLADVQNSDLMFGQDLGQGVGKSQAVMTTYLYEKNAGIGNGHSVTSLVECSIAAAGNQHFPGEASGHLAGNGVAIKGDREDRAGRGQDHRQH